MNSNFKKLALISTIGMVSQVQAGHGTPKDCYTCAESGTDPFICVSDGFFFPDQNMVACCEAGDTSYYCSSLNKYNTCSPPKSEIQNSIYSFCPNQPESKCDNVNNMQATATKQTKTVSGLEHD